MDSISDLFDSYETDYLQLIESIKLKLKEDACQLQGDQRRALLRRIEMELEEADEIVAQMEIEAQTMDAQEKARIKSKVKGFKAELAWNRADLKTLLESTNRDELLSSSASDHISLSMPPSRSDSPSYAAAQASRTRLLSATDKLTDGQRRLEESHRVALETEQVGSGILNDLRAQRETLVHTRENLYMADGSIDRASNTLQKMVHRMYQQRAVTYTIIAILVLLILFVVYAKLF